MDYLNYSGFNSLIAFLGGGLLVIGLLVLVFLIVEIVASWKVFKKAGRNGWESIIPFYSYYVLVEIAGLNWWWFLLLIIDVALRLEIEGLILAINICGFLANFNCYYNIARRFGKDKTTSIFAGIFPFIFILIFGFSKKEVYDSSIPVSVNGIFGPEDTINNNGYNHRMNNDLGNSDKQYNYDESTISVDKDNDNSKKENDKKNEYSFCGECGTKLGKDIKFCPNCGKKKM